MGFLGQHLIHEILSRDSEVEIVILDLFRNKFLYPEDETQVTVVSGVDITNYDQIHSNFESIDLVFHVAAIMKYGRRNRSILHKINAEGTKNVLKACIEHNVKTLVQVGSIGMLQYEKNGDLSDGSTYLNWNKEGFAYYGYSKFEAVDAVLSSESSLKVMVGHPGIMLGPGDVKSQPLIRAGRNFKLFVVPAGGTNFIDVRDVALGLVHIAENGADRSSYLLTNHNLTHKQLIKSIAEATSNKIRVGKLPSFLTFILSPLVWALEFIMPKLSLLSKEGTIKSFHKRYFDNSQTQNELKWKPKYVLEETIRSQTEWLISEGRLK